MLTDGTTLHNSPYLPHLLCLSPSQLSVCGDDIPSGTYQLKALGSELELMAIDDL